MVKYQQTHSKPGQPKFKTLTIKNKTKFFIKRDEEDKRCYYADHNRMISLQPHHG